jgi:formate dehydrogenase subunit gamma
LYGSGAPAGDTREGLRVTQLMASIVADLPRAADREVWDPVRGAEIIGAQAHRDGAALPILHDLQAAFGYVPKASEAMIAEALNLSRAEVHGVVSFYHDFHSELPGRRVLKICRAEACQSVGGVAIAERLLARLGVQWGETTPDGSLTIEPTFCLGLCACAPAALLDETPLARIDDAGLAQLVQQAAQA